MNGNNELYFKLGKVASDFQLQFQLDGVDSLDFNIGFQEQGAFTSILPARASSLCN